MTPQILLLPTFPPIFSKHSDSPSSPTSQFATASFQNSNITKFLLSNIVSLSIALSFNSPLPSLAIPSLNSQSSLSSPATPFSQSQNLQIGLENGKIRPCPSSNPGCVSTNPKSSSFTFPWVIPENAVDNAVQKLQDVILKTQKNAKIQIIEDTPDDRLNSVPLREKKPSLLASGMITRFSGEGEWVKSSYFEEVIGFPCLLYHVLGQYLQAEVDGGLGRDVLEFLVKRDVVAYRSMATKVTYIYPFTTAFGDSKGQLERMKKIVEQLGWYAPDFESMD